MRNGMLSVIGLLCLAAASQPAFAETRTLKLFYVHTNERAEVTYKRNGKYLSEGLKKANHMLRDWRRNEPTKMDVKTLDILWEVYRASGSRDYIHVVSAYRSPATNAMLRRTRGGQAEKSQHLLGKAIDFYLPDVKLSKLRAIAFKIQGGGVGFYPRSGSPFVHVDSGNVRAWPRMSRNELLALFPDGKTVHLPADGKPLPGYQAALAAYKNGKGKNSSIVVDNSSSEKKPTLWAALFGGGADESDDEADVSIVAANPPAKAPVAMVAAKPTKPAKPLAVDIAALQPDAMDGAPDTSGSGQVASIQPEQNATQAALALAAIAVVAPAYTALPKRNAPVPSAAPRLAAAQAEEVTVAAIEPIDPANVEAAQALAEAEIAAIDFDANSKLPADGPVPTPRPVLAVASTETGIPADSVDIAALSADPAAVSNQDELRAAFAPVPEAAPGRDIGVEPLTPAETDMALEDGAFELASLPANGPIPELRRDTLSATPETIQPVIKNSAAIGANLKTGVKTTGKSPKLIIGKIVQKKAVQQPELPLLVNPDRFGPISSQSASNDVSKLKKADKGPRILPDGSTLVSSGKIAP